MAAVNGDEPETHPPARALWVTLAVLVVSNVVANEYLKSGWYVPWNLSIAAVLLLVSGSLGQLSLRDVGLGSAEAASGLRWGAAIGGAIAAVILLLAVVPATRGLFEDEIGGIDGAELALRILVTIPFGTVVMEEIAFRGVFPALLDRRPGWTLGRSSAVSSVLFGLWHILPSRGLDDRNEALGMAVDGAFSHWLAIGGAVIATTVAGWLLLWLRRRSNSVVAPMLVHFALNAAATAATWIAAR